MKNLSHEISCPRSSIACLTAGALKGSWHISREITDMPISAGKLEFSELIVPHHTGHALLYREKIKLETLHGAALAGSREYIYLFHQDRLEIFFCLEGKLGELFMTLTLDSERKCEGSIKLSPHTYQCTHYCGADTYHGEFEFSLPDKFKITYRVEGPRKDYVICSFYSRVNGASK